MKKSPFENLVYDRHTVSMEPDKMDTFSAEESLFAEQSRERQIAVEDALERMPNARYRRVLIGLYHDKSSPKMMAEEMGITLSNFYNLHRRALNQLRGLIQPPSRYLM